MTNAIPLYVLLVVVMSLVTLVAYWLDKRRAANGSRRIPERTLHLLSVLGGWPGALIGQQQFRHKTQKLSFRIVFWLTVLLHVGIVATVAYVYLIGKTSQ